DYSFLPINRIQEKRPTFEWGERKVTTELDMMCNWIN
ncbi:MAG: hypothetical protein ACI837_003502, partial [Crocinitomicaceae bacterium]